MRRKSSLTDFRRGTRPLITPLRDTPPLLTSCAGHAPPWRPASVSHLPSEKRLPPLPSEGPGGPFSPLPWLEGDPPASTLTPQRLPCPGQLPAAPRLCAERCSAHRPASLQNRRGASSSGLSPPSDLTQGTLNSQPIGAAKWGICLQDQPRTSACQKEGVTSPQGGPELGRAGVSKRKQG